MARRKTLLAVLYVARERERGRESGVAFKNRRLNLNYAL